jgi:hypothetical protein
MCIYIHLHLQLVYLHSSTYIDDLKEKKIKLKLIVAC